MPVNHPHNNVFEKVMQLPQAVSALIQHFFPKDILSELDLSTLQQEHDSFITKDLKPYFADVIYSCERKGKPTYISFLFEHKSSYELPDLQLLTYTTEAYKRQQINSQVANKELKEQKQPTQKHVPTPVLPVLLYHGTEPWKKQSLVDIFDLPNEAFKRYIPSIDYILIDLQQYADNALEAIQMKILMTMLLLFKHKGDKEYILRNCANFFIFVEKYPDSRLSKEYTRIFVLYISQSFYLNKKDIQEVMSILPETVKKEFMTTYDLFVTEGYKKGKLEGEIKGEIKVKLKIFVDLLVTLPTATDDLFVTLTKFPKAVVISLKKALNGRTKKNVLKIGRPLFEAIPNMGEAQWKEVDRFLEDLWKGYKKQLRERK